jgi:hypothetical protein
MIEIPQLYSVNSVVVVVDKKKPSSKCIIIIMERKKQGDSMIPFYVNHE